MGYGFLKNGMKRVGLRHKIDFGKYKGKTVKTILDEDPSYLIWAHEQTERLKLRSDIYKKAIEFQEEIDSERFESLDYSWGSPDNF